MVGDLELVLQFEVDSLSQSCTSLPLKHSKANANTTAKPLLARSTAQDNTCFKPGFCNRLGLRRY